MRKWRYFCVAIAMWNPKPYIGYSSDAPLSFLMYKKVKRCDYLYQRSLFGSIWEDVWFAIAGYPFMWKIKMFIDININKLEKWWYNK